MAKTSGTVHLVRGDDKIVPITFRKDSGLPLDLTGTTAITATFKTKNQSVASVTMAAGKIEIISAEAGVIHITLDSAFTTNLADGDRQDFQVDLIISGKRMAFRFEEAMNVAESLSAVS